MIKPGNKIKVYIGSNKYEAILERIVYNSDAIQYTNNNTRELILTNGRNALYKFVISYKDNTLLKALEGANNIEIEGEGSEE